MLFNENIPPRMNEARKRAEAKSVVADFLLDLMLEDPNFPAERKTSLRILKAAKQIHTAIDDIIKAFADPEKEVPQKTAEQALEYLLLVHTGIKQYMQTQNTECTE